MGVIIPAGYAQASFGGLVAGDTEVAWFTLGLDLDGALTPGLASALYDVWTDNLASSTSSDFTFTDVHVKAGPSATGPTDEFSGGTVAGTVLVSMVPINTAVLVRKVTALGGRSGRGRMYPTGQVMVTSVGGAGVLTSSAQSIIDGAWFAFEADIRLVPGVADLVLLHSSSSDPTPITNLQPQPKVATQRRRLRP